MRNDLLDKFIALLAISLSILLLSVACILIKQLFSWPPTPTTPQTTTAAERLLSSCFCFGAQYFICLITKDMGKENEIWEKVLLIILMGAIIYIDGLKAFIIIMVAGLISYGVLFCLIIAIIHIAMWIINLYNKIFKWKPSSPPL